MKTDKKGKRLYINITNHCSANCPFCCMYSNSFKSTYMDFDTFKNIIDKNKDKELEIQLEGGEPLEHRLINLFLEYSASINKCKKIIILTNGKKLGEFITTISNLANRYRNIEFEIKPSFNYHLDKIDNELFYRIQAVAFAVMEIPNINIIINARYYNDKEMRNYREKFKTVQAKINLFPFQAYGKLSDNNKLKKPFIVQNIDEWEIFSCDDKSFGNDLISRSEYEKRLKRIL